MEGGIGIALLIILGVVIGGAAVFMYLTGGAISLTRGGSEKRERRPRHKEPTTPYHEHTRQVPEGKEINT